MGLMGFIEPGGDYLVVGLQGSWLIRDSLVLIYY